MSPAELKQLPMISQQSEVMIQSWDNLLARAEFFAKSALIPTALRGKPADVAIVLQIGWELGIPPMQALNGIDVIQGKPAIKPELLIALVRSRISNAYIKIESTDAEAKVTMARDKNSMDEAYTAVWNMAKATKMGLAGKDNYRSQPGTMFRWRAVMEAGRMIFPDLLKGLYGPVELEDGNQPPPDKGDSIAETIAQVSQPVIEVEHKPVEAKAPEVMPPIPPLEDPVVGDPILDYVIPRLLPFAGRRLGAIPLEALQKGVDKVQRHFESEHKAPSGPYLEFLTRADQRIQREKPLPIAPQAKASDSPSFSDFYTEPGSEG